MATFQDLPAELMIDIFKHVPAAHIQRSRRVCRKFRDTIDINISSLSAEICTREVTRLQATKEWFIDDDPNEVAPEGLRLWGELWGELRSTHMYGSQLVQLSCLENYVPPETQSDRQSSLADAEPFRKRDLRSVCGMIRDTACRLLKSSAKRHEYVTMMEIKDGRPGFSKKSVCTCKDLSEFVQSVPDLDENWARQLYNAILSLGDSFQSGFGSRRYQKSLLIDLMPLLGLYSITGSICETNGVPDSLENAVGIGARWRGVISMPELMKGFSVPSMPRMDCGGRKVAYCVRHRWVSLEIERSQSQREALDPLKKAAILEEMFIY